LAILISIHLGGVLGVLPFNYNPGKILYGSIGDFLNGFLLAIFAILGSTKWTATLVVLGMPILDGLLVVYLRFKSNPQLLRNPLKILQVSDRNHLHHRLLAAGYSKKAVVLVETAMMALICTTTLYFSNIRKDFIALVVGLVFIFLAFTVVFIIMKRNEKNQRYYSVVRPEPKVVISESTNDEPLVKVVFKEDQNKEKEEEKFIY